MRILIIGSGGREHVLAWRLSTDPAVSEIICAPGNPGMARIGRLAPVPLDDPRLVLSMAEREGVDLTVVGPEAPLDHGIADVFAERGRLLLGPVRQAAQLECSKAFAKRFMARHGIPSARFRVCGSEAEALDAVSGPAFGFPVVVKADGLAAGKGVTVAADRGEAEAAVRTTMTDRRFGAAGATVVIEECLVGPEASYFALCDGAEAVLLGSAQDYKRAYDGDRGPNTGGMGALAPSPRATGELARFVMDEVVAPLLRGMRADGAPYRGFLYVSLMLTADGPKVIEFNVRFGDPEAQVVLPGLEGPLAQLLHAAAAGRLGGAPAVRSAADVRVGVVLASGGYPAAARSGVPIHGVERAAAEKDVLVFHAGTAETPKGLVTAGGRVLTVVGRGGDYPSAAARAYAAVRCISFEGMQYRSDIGS